ncbi:MAG: isochorismatase family protein [Kiritimatiellae bacterium]|nr:isochorismatase family protein [Kiritimatiellia bacterium]
MLRLDDTFLVLIDVQEKLSTVMHKREQLIDNCRQLLACAMRLEIPVIWTEQIPSKMGPTLPELQEFLTTETPIEKSSFSCWKTHVFETRVRSLNRKRALLAGIEAHVCVYQTAADLYANGWHVEVVADAVSSRTPQNLQIGLERIQKVGASQTSVETAVFELMQTAEHPAFRDILKLVK